LRIIGPDEKPEDDRTARITALEGEDHLATDLAGIQTDGGPGRESGPGRIQGVLDERLAELAEADERPNDNLASRDLGARGSRPG
jgi:hypothetical protein